MSAPWTTASCLGAREDRHPTPATHSTGGGHEACQVCAIVHKLPNFSVLSITSHKWGYTIMPAPGGPLDGVKLHL